MRLRRSVLLGTSAATLVASAMLVVSPAALARPGVAHRLATGTLPAPVIHTGVLQRKAPQVSAGLAQAAVDQLRAEEADAASGVSGDLSAPTTVGVGPGTLGCSRRDTSAANPHKGGDGGQREGAGDNTRVNQDCTFRRQAEEQIRYNPAEPHNLLAGQNDSRVGFNQCGFDFSVDNGAHWGDGLPPFRQKINNPAAEEPTASDPNRHTIVGGPGTGHTYDAGSDPTVAFDTAGAGYFSCVGFDINSNASLLYVTQAPSGSKGSFFYNIPSSSRKFIVAEDNSPAVFHDKNFISTDINAASPNRNNVYVTWTVFKFDPRCTAGGTQCESPIYGSMSTDGAHTWSTPEQISGTSDSLCFFGNALDPQAAAHSCNFDQGSESQALPNGDLQVIFNNGNTAAGNPNSQQLGVHCTPAGKSQLGTARLNCAGPTKVGADVSSGEPQCNFGRGPEECIPGAFIRTNDFPRITQENAQNNHLYATWQDYRNGEFDVQLAQSLDGGRTWAERGTVNPDRGLDHYFPVVDRAPQDQDRHSAVATDRVGDSYYRTARITNENATPAAGFASCNPNQGGDPTACSTGTGVKNSDYVLAGGQGEQTPYAFKSLSPTFAPPDGNQTGFNGDYSGLVLNQGQQAHPIWSDTRNQNPYPENGVVHDEDVFTTSTALPNGRGHTSQGTLSSP